MNRVIVAFENDSTREKISEMLKTGGINVRFQCRSGGEVIRAVKFMGGGVVVCGHKLTDMTASNMAYDLGDDAMVLVVASAAQLSMCENQNIFRLQTPINSGMLCGSARMLVQMDERSLKSSLTKRSSGEEAVLEKAKALLMERDSLTEAQAHRFIQRRSMAASLKMSETAQKIISAYEK